MIQRGINLLTTLILLSLLAAWLNWDTALQVVAIINAVVAVWANGVAANYKGAPPSHVPNWSANAAIITGFVSIVLIGASFFVS